MPDRWDDGGVMNLSRVTLIAAITAVSAWGVKALAIGSAGGFDKSPLEAPLFFVGLLAMVVAASTFGWTLASGRSTALRVAASIGTLIAAIACSVVVGALISELVSSDYWVWGEANLWVSAVALLVIVVIRHRRSAPGH